MADIRIKDLATTASVTASDDFMAVDGTTSGTRKLSAATPSFATSVTVPGVSGPTSTDLTLAGGSSGASLVLGHTTQQSSLTGGGAAVGSSANLVVGATAGVSTNSVGVAQISASSDTYSSIVSIGHNAATGNTGYIFVGKSRGTKAAPTIVADTDILGEYGFIGYDGSAYRTSAAIRALISGTPGATDLPTRLAFFTASDGSSSPTERATITPTGNLLIGTTSETGLTGAGGLKINSSTAGSASAGALVVTGGLSTGDASYFGGTITAVKSLNSDFSNFITNVNAGAAAEANLYVSNAGTGATSATLGVMGTGYTTTGGFVQDAGVVTSGTGLAGGLSIMARAASSDIRFYAGSYTNLVATFASTGAATFAGAVSVAGTITGSGTNTWALQSVGASGALVAGGWLYGINNGFNITPNGAGVAGATLMLAAFDGTGYREMLSTANVASGASTLRLAGYGGPTTVGGTFAVTGAATFSGAVTIAGTVIHTLSATPASASATGTVGTMSWDASYIYICTATNTWKRVAIATW